MSVPSNWRAWGCHARLREHPWALRLPISGPPIMPNQISGYVRSEGTLTADLVATSGPAGQTGPPAFTGIGGGRGRPERSVDHQRQQLILRRHVAIERHGRGTELLGDPGHRHRPQPLGAGDAHGRLDDPLQAQARLGSLARALAPAPGASMLAGRPIPSS